jgi:creatinine amidohydrolase
VRQAFKEVRMHNYWHYLDTERAREVAAGDPVLVLPLGAIEQHGPHLPLATDLLIIDGLLDAAWSLLPGQASIWRLPSIAVGASAEHRGFAGTLTHEPETMIRLIVDIGEQLALIGIRRLVLCNGHGGNRQVMDLAALRLRTRQRMLVVKANYFRYPLPADLVLPEQEQRHGFHGGALETSLMLHLHPQLVRRDGLRQRNSLGQQLADGFSRIGPEGQAGFAWLASDLNPEGAVGDAGLASAELGARCAAVYARAIAETLLEAARFPLDALALQP